jgi:predicted MFS family arabinose efflux permease
MDKTFETGREGYARQGFVILTLFGILFLASVDNQLLIPLLPGLSREFAESIQALGWIFSGYAFSAALFNLWVGPLSDRRGRVGFLRVGLLAFVVLALLTRTAEEFETLLLFRIGAGAVAGVLSTCTASFVGDFFPYERRGRVMGIVLSSYFAALIFGIPIGSWVAQNWGWRTVFLFSSILGVGLFLLALLKMPSDRPQNPRHRNSRPWRAYLYLLRGKDTVGALSTSFLISGGTLAFLTFISAYLDAKFGMKPVEIASVFMVVGAGAIVASPLAGWLSDRLTKRRVFLISNTVLILPLLAIDRVPAGVPLLAVLFLVSLCVAFRQTALQTLQTGLIPNERRGSFLALRNCFSQLGISAAVVVAGYCYSSFGYGGVTKFAASLTLLGSIILCFSVSEPNDAASE